MLFISPELKIIFSGIATFIAIIAYIPYLIDMFKGTNKPHLYNWITIFLVTITVAYTQFIGGAGVGAIPTILGCVVNGVILFFCFKFGTKDIVFVDKVCLVISIIGVLSYVVFRADPFISLAVVTIAEVTSFFPTFRKTRNDPYSESLSSYYFLMTKLILILLALQNYNLLTVSYSVLWLGIFIVFLSCTYYWRATRPRELV